MVLRPDVPVRLPGLGLDPGRPQPGAARHHVAVLLARGHQPRATARSTRGNGRGRTAGARCGSARSSGASWATTRVDRWYAAVGSRVLRRRGEDPRCPSARGGDRTAPASIPTLVERAIADPSTTDDGARRPRRSRRAATAAHGVPTIVFESGYAVYGPVVVPAPTGDDARRAVGARARHAAVPAPVRAPAPEDDATICVHIARAVPRPTSRRATGRRSRTRRS